MGINARQKRFADLWLESFNATEAARKAGYSEKTAAAIGYENLRKPKIAAYIHARLRAQDMSIMASQEETMAFLTSAMRGQVKDQFGLDATLSDRLRAGEALIKRYAATDRSRDSLEKLDSLLREFKDAVKSEAE